MPPAPAEMNPELTPEPEVDQNSIPSTLVPPSPLPMGTQGSIRVISSDVVMLEEISEDELSAHNSQWAVNMFQTQEESLDLPFLE